MTPAELFKVELEALLKKYPTVRMEIVQSINISDVKPPVEKVVIKKKKRKNV